MKLLFFFVALILGNTLHASTEQTCANISGKYTTGRVILDTQYVASIYQTSCDSIALGSFTIKNGIVGEEHAPTVLYVTEKARALCEAQACTIFQNTPTGISFVRRGTAPGNPNCRYDRVDWRLDENGDLLQTYFINDSTAKCRGVETQEHRLYRLK